MENSISRRCDDRARSTGFSRNGLLRSSVDSAPAEAGAPTALTRRGFLKTAAAATVLAGAGLREVGAAGAPPDKTSSESLVKLLYDSLNASQRTQVCFPWDHHDTGRGLLRTRVSPNWHVTEPLVDSGFYTADQQRLIREIFLGLVQPDWVARLDRQLKDDDDGFGKQSVAIFGAPGGTKFEFVLSGRHITLRCDGHSAEHVAFGGPIVYGHAASGFHEKPGHPGNVFWPQAAAANSVFKMLDGRQRAEALIKVAAPRKRRRFPRPQGQSAGHRREGPFRRPEVPRAIGAGDAYRALPPVRPRPRGGVPQGTRRAGRVSFGVFRARPPAAGRIRRSGGWKGRHLSGTSAACRTFIPGSTWPTIPQ